MSKPMGLQSRIKPVFATRLILMEALQVGIELCR